MGINKDFSLSLGKQGKTADPTQPGSWLWPTSSRNISQGVTSTHKALDIPGRLGDPVFASARGRVSAVNYQPGGYGTNVRIITNDGREIILGHLSGVNVKPGDLVAPGQVVGLLGSTGNSTGPHLHFEIKLPGADSFQTGWTSTRTAFDPWAFLGSSPRTPTTPTPALSSFQLTPTSSLVPKESLAYEIGKAQSMSDNPASASTWGQALATNKKAPATVFGKVHNPTGSKPLVKDSKNGAPEPIKIANLGVFGDVTIPKIGAYGKRVVIGAVAVLVFYVALGALLAESPKVRRVAEAVATSTPVGAGIKAAVGK